MPSLIELIKNFKHRDELGNSMFNFQNPASLGMEKVFSWHLILLCLCFTIITLILCLLIYVIFRFHESRNKIPSKTTHNTVLEVIWGGVPLLIVMFLAINAVRILKFTNIVPKTEMTLKVVSHQWYWSYEYPDLPDNIKISFDAYFKKDEELGPNDIRLLSTDNPIYLPIDTNIKILITSGDVIHSWAVPAFGIKTDAIPGRLNETWVNITKPGRYFGQCSELCGIDHGFMPIEIHAVSKDDYKKWVQFHKKKDTSNSKNEKSDVKIENSDTKSEESTSNQKNP